jgi:hypothetical protein
MTLLKLANSTQNLLQTELRLLIGDWNE